MSFRFPVLGCSCFISTYLHTVLLDIFFKRTKSCNSFLSCLSLTLSLSLFPWLSILSSYIQERCDSYSTYINAWLDFSFSISSTLSIKWEAILDVTTWAVHYSWPIKTMIYGALLTGTLKWPNVTVPNVLWTQQPMGKPHPTPHTPPQQSFVSCCRDNHFPLKSASALKICS